MADNYIANFLIRFVHTCDEIRQSKNNVDTHSDAAQICKIYFVHDNETLFDFVRQFSVECSATSIKTVSNALFSIVFLSAHSMSNLDDGLSLNDS